MNEASLAQGLDATPDAVAVTRLSDGLIKHVNRGFSELFGYSAEEVLGKTAIELNIWVDPQARKALIEEIERHGEIGDD